MDLKKIFADALAELPKDATPEQLVAYIQAKAQVEAAIEGKPETAESEAPAADLSTDGQEPEKPPTVDDANPGTPAALADKPEDTACADVPAAPPPAEGAGGTEPNAQPSQGGDPAIAAAEECFGMMKQATGMDDAALLAWCRANMDAIGALAKKGGTDSVTGLTQLTRDLRVADGQVKALTAKLAEYEANDAKVKADAETAKRTAAEARVDALIESGRVLDVARADLVGLALENPARFEGIVKTMPQAVPAGRVAAKDDADRSGVDDVDEATLSTADREWFKAFDVQCKSTIPDPKARRALAAKALRERTNAPGFAAPTNGRA